MSEFNSYERTVMGGPLDGQRVTCNAAKGFVLVDLDRNLAWVYDNENDPTAFFLRAAEPINFDKLAKAQEDGGRAVMVYSEEDHNG